MSQTEEREAALVRRKHKRISAREVTAEIHAGGSSQNYGVLNISTGGLLVAGGAPLPTRVLLEIELRLAGGKPVHVSGRVVHQLPQGTGLAFEPFSSSVAESFARLIAAVEERNNLPPPLPPRGTREEPALKLDPFAVGPDPRPPRSSAPEERVDYLRALVKKREEALQRGKTAYTALAAEVEEARAATARIKAKLDAALSQLALGEAALAAARKSAEKQAEELEAERAGVGRQLEEERAGARELLEHEQRRTQEAIATAQEMVEQEQRRTLEAIATVAGLEAKMRHFESEAASAKQEAEAVRREAKGVVTDAAALRKTREELGLANKKAMESQVGLTKERAGRVAAEAAAQEATEAQRAAEAEAKRLASELARLKSKLIAAESALERSATRKAPDPQRAARKP